MSDLFLSPTHLPTHLGELHPSNPPPRHLTPSIIEKVPESPQKVPTKVPGDISGDNFKSACFFARRFFLIELISEMTVVIEVSSHRRAPTFSRFRQCWPRETPGNLGFYTELRCTAGPGKPLVTWGFIPSPFPLPAARGSIRGAGVDSRRMVRARLAARGARAFDSHSRATTGTRYAIRARGAARGSSGAVRSRRGARRGGAAARRAVRFAARRAVRFAALIPPFLFLSH